MEELSTRVRGILSKMNVVLDKYIQMEKEYLEIREERNTLKRQLEDQNKEIYELQEEVKFLKISKSVTLSHEDNKELGTNIDEIIKEIDRCIALLNN